MTQQLSEKQLEILHDHFKETFENIREREKLRDRLFVWVILAFALLSVQILYPKEFDSASAEVGVFGGSVHLDALPLAALLTATWVLTLELSLRYCRATVYINRQYPYLHYLERVISPELGGGRTYTREGAEYEKDYPRFLDVVWIAYVFIFPIVLTVAVTALISAEIFLIESSSLHKALDAAVAGALVALYAVYIIYPGVKSLRTEGATNAPVSSDEIIS